MNHYLRSVCVFGLAVLCCGAPGAIRAQDEVEKTPAPKPAKAPSTLSFLPTALELKAEEDRRRARRQDSELRSRLANTVWNDLDLRAGQPGQVWMFHPPKQQGGKDVRDWYLNDDVRLPRVGSWDVKDQGIMVFAMNGTLIGRGKYADDEITGHFIDPDRKQEYGKFRLREETKRNYRVLPLRVNQPRLGK